MGYKIWEEANKPSSFLPATLVPSCTDQPEALLGCQGCGAA